MRQPPRPDDPDTLRGPGGLTLREVHALVRKSVERDQTAQAAVVASPRGFIDRLAADWKKLKAIWRR